MDIAKNLETGQRIMNLRKQNGWSRNDLSQKTELTYQAISLIERGKRGLSSYSIYKLCLAFNVSSDYLLFGLTDIRTHLKQNSELLSGYTDEEQEEMLKIIDMVAEMVRKYKK